MDLAQALAEIEKLKGDKEKLLNEKKDMLKLFEDKDKEDMTDNEKKIAEILEKSNAKQTELEKKLEEEKKLREDGEKKRADDAKTALDKEIAERLERVAKGDPEVLKKMQANVALLDKMPTSTPKEIDAVINSAFNMMGSGQVNPLLAVNNTEGGGGEPQDSGFAESAAGKSLGKKLGMSFAKDPAPKEGEGDKK